MQHRWAARRRMRWTPGDIDSLLVRESYRARSPTVSNILTDAEEETSDCP